jgi:hypothetical protein
LCREGSSLSRLAFLTSIPRIAVGGQEAAWKPAVGLADAARGKIGTDRHESLRELTAKAERRGALTLIQRWQSWKIGDERFVEQAAHLVADGLIRDSLP